jgi:hypothetical protein
MRPGSIGTNVTGSTLDDTLLRDATSAIPRDHLERNEAVPVYTKTFVVESALKALLREHAARRLSRMFGAAPPALRSVWASRSFR